MLNRQNLALVAFVMAAISAVAYQTIGQNAADASKTDAAILKGEPLALPPLKTIPREQQIQLALSAAPPQISGQASLYVLESKGYIKVRAGSNGFTCLVEQQYANQTVEPVCYDAEGTATTLPARLYREELRAAGVPEAEVKLRIAAGYKKGSLKAPRKPGLCYMLSTQNKVFDTFTQKIMAAPPHLMFYAPYATQKDLGDFAGVQYPFLLWEGQPDAHIIVIHAAKEALQHVHATGDRQ